MRNTFNYLACTIILSCTLACSNNNSTAKTADNRKPHKNIPHIIERHSCTADYGLSGKVKSMYTKRYMLSGEKKVLAVGYYSLFDEQGNITESRVDKTANNPEMGYRSKYDANGNDTLTLEYLADGKRGDSTVCKYDQWGNMVTRISYHSDGQKWDSQSFKYDDRDSMTDVYSERILPDGILKVSGQYKYNEKGQLTEVVLEWGGGKMAQQYSKGTNTYNAAGKLQESKEYDRDGKLTKRSVYTYDNSGRQTGLSEYSAADSLKERWEYVYDAKGNKTATNIYGPDGKLSDYSTAYQYQYDDKGNITRKNSYSMVAGKKVATETEEVELKYY